MNLTNNINKLGTIGLFLTAILSPCCFPLLGIGLIALGFGSFELFGGWTMWIFQGLVIVSVAGLLISYYKYRSLYPLLIAIPSGFLIFYSYYFINNANWAYFLYAGMIGLLIATIVNYYRSKSHDKVIELECEITCPNCGYKKKEIMPSDSCVYFYECEKCQTRLKPLEGDCCVYCSFGTVKCPPVQGRLKCC